MNQVDFNIHRTIGKDVMQCTTYDLRISLYNNLPVSMEDLQTILSKELE